MAIVASKSKTVERGALAEKYRQWGWSVIPLSCGTKVPPPGRSWKHRQKTRPSAKQVEKAWPEGTDENIGIVCGKVSGGLIVRDFDEANEYHQWASDRPELAATLPTVRTRRGFHVYLRDSEGFTDSPNLRPYGMEGEIKGDRTYVVAVGSVVEVERDGEVLEAHQYTWKVRPVVNDGKAVIPEISLMESGLVPINWCKPDTVISATPGTPGIAATPLIPATIAVSNRTRTRDFAIDGPGQRHKALGRLAMRVACEAFVKKQSITSEEFTEYLRRIHRLWWRRYGHFCTSDEEESEVDFFDWVYGVREGNFLILVERVLQKIGPLDWGKSFGPPSVQKVLRVLVAADVCRNERETFFLGARQAGPLAGVGREQASAAIRVLTKRGCVRLVKRFDYGSGKANEYQLLVGADGKPRK